MLRNLGAKLALTPGSLDCLSLAIIRRRHISTPTRPPRPNAPMSRCLWAKTCLPQYFAKWLYSSSGPTAAACRSKKGGMIGRTKPLGMLGRGKTRQRLATLRIAKHRPRGIRRAGPLARRRITNIASHETQSFVPGTHPSPKNALWGGEGGGGRGESFPPPRPREQTEVNLGPDRSHIGAHLAKASRRQV